MPDGLEARVHALEQDFSRLYELVDGQEEWSHRKRLHAIENNARAAELAAQALQAFQDARNSKSTRLREWAAFVFATVALLRPWQLWS